MKKIFSLIWTLFFFNLLFGQIAYYDAISITKILENDTLKYSNLSIFVPIIKNYISDDLKNQSNVNIGSKLNNPGSKYYNPFLAEFLLDYNKSHSIDFSSIGIFKDGAKAISGIDVTTFADGLAQFMIERAKGEISVAFIQRFKNEMEKHPELQVLFPKTSDFLENMMAYEYTIMLPVLQKAFDDDLSKMFFNTRNIFELPEYRKVIDSLPEVGILLNSMYTIAKLEYGVHPADIIKELNDLPDWENHDLKGTELMNLKAVINIGNLISQSLRFKDTVMLLANNGYVFIQTPDSLYKQKPGKDTITLVKYYKPAWVSDHHLDLLLKDETCFKIFLGLLYQQSLKDSIHFVIHMPDKGMDTTIFFHKFLDKNKENIYFLKSQFLKFQRLAGDVDYHLARINELKREGKKPSKQDYYKFVDVSLDVTEYGSNFVSYFAKDNNQFSEIKSNQYLSILRDINEFYKSSYSKDYSTMITYGVNVLDAVYDIYVEKKAGKKLQAKADNRKKDKNKNKYISPFEKKHKKIVNREKGEFPKVISSIMRYGTFMAQIAKADSGTQVKEIIETFALPVGSSSLKKYQVNNVAVNSYLGMSYKNSDPLRSKNEGIFRFYAPVGVSWTPFSFGKGGSISLFASLLDIGAIVDYRLKYIADTTISISGGVADTTITKNIEYSNKIQLGNILSPGGYIVYGFGGNLPLALGVGAQYGPGLSKITNDVNELNKPKWMFNVSLTVDIPIINLHPGRRKRF